MPDRTGARRPIRWGWALAALAATATTAFLVFGVHVDRCSDHEPEASTCGSEHIGGPMGVITMSAVGLATTVITAERAVRR